MPTEPDPITLAQVIHRAVEDCDPAGIDDDLAELFLRLVDADEPITAIQNIAQRLAECAGVLDPQGESSLRPGGHGRRGLPRLPP